MIHVHLGGHLSWYDRQKRSRLEIEIGGPLALADLIRQLGLPASEIAVAAINGSAAAVDRAMVRDGDRVDLLPPVGGGASAD